MPANNLTLVFSVTGTHRKGLDNAVDETAINNNGGAINNGDPAIYPGLFGSYIRTGAVQFYNDQDFINSGAIGQFDNYSNLFLSTLHVSAANAGRNPFAALKCV